jgi:hypothetical protein
LLPADLGLLYLCVLEGVVLVLLFVKPLLDAGLLYLCEDWVDLVFAGLLFVVVLLALDVEVLAGFLYEYLCLVVLAGFCFGVDLSFVDEATSAPVVPAVPLITGVLVCDLLKFPVVELPPDLVREDVLATSLVVLVGVERVEVCEFVADVLRDAVSLKALGLLS